MTNHHLTGEIHTVRERLREIEVECSRLPEDELEQKSDLKREEHELRARLIRLQDATFKDWDTAELPGVPG